jgi:hypothetical protein
MFEQKIEVKEVEPESGPVSIWVFRHFTPHPKYQEDKPLVLEKARGEATEAARTLVENVKDGEIIALYGAGTKGRHLESFRLLKDALKQELHDSGKDVTLVEPKIAKRRSLRPVELWYYREIPEALGREVDYWLETRETVGGKVETPEHVFQRFRTLIKGLIQFTKRQSGENRVHWVLITSGELLSPQKIGLKPGGWLRIDIAPGEFTGRANFVHYSGRKEEINLS